MRHALLALIGAASVTFACSEESSGPSLDDPRELIREMLAGLHRSGEVFHAKLDKGSEYWIDANAREFRFEAADELLPGRKWLSVGQGLTVTSYDPGSNEVNVRDLSREGLQSLILEEPAAYWLPPLYQMEVADEVTFADDGPLEDALVIVLEAHTLIPFDPSDNDVAPGTQSLVHLEIDREQLLPLAYEEFSISAGGERLGGPRKVTYVLTEFIPRTNLSADFFDAGAVQDALVTLQDEFEGVRAMGIEPYWLGERLETDYGTLVVDGPQTREWANDVLTYYRLERGSSVLSFAVTVWLNRNLGGNCGDFNGPRGPEISEDVMVQGKPAILSASLLPPDAGCGYPSPSPQQTPQYHRLSMEFGTSAVEIEVSWRASSTSGYEDNPLNNRDALLVLGEALVPVE